MKTATANGQKPRSLAENALAKQVLENIWKIEQEAKQRKLEQLEGLKAAKHAILLRINELNHQLVQIDEAMVAIRGSESQSHKQRTIRRNLGDVRERVARWMEGRRGQRFMARELVNEFPEMEGAQVSLFLRPLIDAGKLKTDATEGMRRMKYYVET